MKLSIIIPCYNEEKNIKLLLKKCIDVFKNDKNIEYIFINDGSSDNTWKEIQNLLSENSYLSLVGINFSRNFGKEAAMYAGLKISKGEYCAIMDADLQQHPKYVKQMLDFIVENNEYDCVTCYQKSRKENKILIFLKNCFYSVINNISEIELHKNASDFRLMNRKMVDTIISMEEHYRFSKGIFSFVGFNNYYMPYNVETRKYGKSSWSVMKLFKYAFDGILSFTIRPLKIAFSLGIITFITSIIYLLIILINSLMNNSDISITYILIFLIIFFNGLEMIMIGISGKYIGRTYVESLNRPIYIIKDIESNR